MVMRFIALERYLYTSETERDVCSIKAWTKISNLTDNGKMTSYIAGNGNNHFTIASINS